MKRLANKELPGGFNKPSKEEQLAAVCQKMYMPAGFNKPSKEEQIAAVCQTSG